jgi:alanine racemase
MIRYRDTYAIIRLDYLNENIEYVYNKVKKPMMAIIKANAYGHGYKEVGEALKDNPHISMYGVATLKEAIDLRKIGIEKDILVLGPIPLDDIDIAIQYDISLTMFSIDYLKEIKKYHNNKKPVKVHIKIDTGMNRLGFKNINDYSEMMKMIDSKIFNIEGIFTHFATADEPEKYDEYKKQLSMFYKILDNQKFKYIHCQNSAAMLYHHEEISNLSRIGIVMYGIDPTGEENPKLKQVMSLYSKVSMLKIVPKGEKIGYGMTYQTKQDEYIATVPIGYADGIIRANQGRNVYINGKTYPIVGRVCMDQMMVKVDETVKLHDKVEIFGEHISICSMAKDLNTIPYEIPCLISERVERIYKK